MLIYHDPDRYETISETRTCPYHTENPGKQPYAGCTCSGMIYQRAVSEEEYQRRRDERIRKEEDETLARAEAIKAKRAAASPQTNPHKDDE